MPKKHLPLSGGPTITDLQPWIGRRGLLAILTGSDALYVQVRVTNVRLNYGQIQIQVTPKDGDGQTWVDFRRLTPDS